MGLARPATSSQELVHYMTLRSTFTLCREGESIPLIGISSCEAPGTGVDNYILCNLVNKVLWLLHMHAAMLECLETVQLEA